ELEPPARGHERAVGDVDRDPLLALGAQPVGEEGEVHVAVAAAQRGRLDVLELVGEDLLRVVEQPAEQGRLAVVDRAGGDEPQQLGLHHLLGDGHQKYPPRLRSSMAASETRSSARVSPRSVTFVAAISETTSSIVAARDSTPPVQVMSPTVRNLTQAL